MPSSRAEFERRWAGLKAHNRWLADFCSLYPDRRAGIAELLLYDVDEAVAEVRAIHERGMRGGVVLPVDGAEGGLVPLYDRAYDPLWAVCADLVVPVHRHAKAPGGPVSAKAGPSGSAIGALELSFWDHRALSHLIFSGVFERHPDLRFVFTESGVSWIPVELARLDSFYFESLHGQGIMAYLADALKELTMTPSEYFARNCWVGASLLTPKEVSKRHEVGISKIMWGHDYPHSEGVFPYTRSAYSMLFAELPEDEIVALLGGNAAEMYHFDLDAMQVVADRIGPTVAEIRSHAFALPVWPEETISPVFHETPGRIALGR
jgi:predicted TIM-barrel fold metal-dependent hydrolase